MLQRIQTVYLSFAILALALVFAFPMAQFLSENGAWEFSVTGLKDFVPGGAPLLNPMIFLPLPVVNIATILLLGFSISAFRRRTFQIRLINFGILLCILEIAAVFFAYVPLVQKHTGIVPDYTKGFGVYLLLAALVFEVLAMRAVKRDEKLVRSADRLR